MKKRSVQIAESLLEFIEEVFLPAVLIMLAATACFLIGCVGYEVIQRVFH